MTIKDFTRKANGSIESVEAMRQSIIAKGVGVPANLPFSGYGEKILAIGGVTKEVQYMRDTIVFLNIILEGTK